MSGIRSLFSAIKTLASVGEMSVSEGDDHYGSTVDKDRQIKLGFRRLNGKRKRIATKEEVDRTAGLKAGSRPILSSNEDTIAQENSLLSFSSLKSPPVHDDQTLIEYMNNTKRHNTSY